jgi:hypothetical protein
MAPYEWWCPRCRVTHPPGRKACVHCGGRVQPSREAAPAPLPFPPEAEPGEATGSEDAEAPVARPLRLGLTLTWLALAVGAAILRMCSQGGQG